MSVSIRFSCFIVLFAGFLYSCATPSSPTGGPPDEQSPAIVATEPETGTTNFDGRSITFHFSEFINRSSVSNAITIEPNVGLNYSLDWGRKSLEISFSDELPDSTTLIVTLGTDLRDMNGNKLASPATVAVSTGPEIDKGLISGRVVDARTGLSNEGNSILLYREPVDLSARANYSAETDTGGTFQFSYLSQGTYKAFWVDDRNRNRIWDREIERAQPFSREFITLNKAGSDTLKTLYIAQSDTSRPEFMGVGLFSGRRLRLRFSEGVTVLDSTHIVINDSTGQTYSTAYPLYVSPEDPYVVLGYSEKGLAPQDSFEVVLYDISDTYGNVQERSSRSTTGSAQSDTTLQRIIGRTSEAGLFPNEPLEVVYAKPITDEAIQDSSQIIAGRELVKDPGSFIQAKQNRLLVMPPNGWKRGLEYEIRIWDPSRNTRRKITPNIWHENDLGELYIQLADTASRHIYHLAIENEELGVVADTTFSGSVQISELPPLSYQVTAYEDLNGNGQWDSGHVEPYQAPEPYYIRNDIPVKSGFTSDLTLSFGNRNVN